MGTTHLITGASGPFGRQAAQLLLESIDPGDLILVTRNPGKLADFAARGVQVRHGDFGDPASLRAAFEGAQRALLISTDAVGGKRLVQHRQAIDAARAAGVGHVVYTSFVGVGNGNPAISAQEHEATERMLRDSGMAWTFLRDSQYAEAIVLFAAPGALASGHWLAASGEGRVALVSRDDCIACAAAVLRGSGHENRHYDITGPQALSYRDCAALAAEFGGRPIAYTVCSDEDKLRFFDSLGVPRRIHGDEPMTGPIPWPSEEMVSFERAIREGFFDVVSGDVERLLGRPPRSLREVFATHAAALKP